MKLFLGFLGLIAGDATKCSNDNDCGIWKSCNFDYGDSGFCEPCYRHITARGCQKAGFINKAGFDACVRVCAKGINLLGYQWIDESKPVPVTNTPLVPRPHTFTRGNCNNSDQCDNGRHMCNFDDGTHGFCENCANFMTPEACQGTGFITARGFDNCIKHCNGGVNSKGIRWIDERVQAASRGIEDALPFDVFSGWNLSISPDEPPIPDQHIFTPGKCTDSYQCDKGLNLCNFDDGDHGFCENCRHFKSAEDCQGTGFITRAGFDNCIKHCVGGVNPNGIEWIDEKDDHPISTATTIPDVHVFNPGKCSDSYHCDNGKNMCNFDDGNTGFCENCDYFRAAKSCQMTGFITKAGFDNCIKHCAGGVNPDGVQWINERS